MSNIKNILIFHKSQTSAHELSTALQNAGTTIITSHVSTLEQLAQTVKKQTWELIVLCPQSANLAKDILMLIRPMVANIPVILLLDSCNEETRYRALKLGATDAISHSALDLFILVVKRCLAIQPQSHLGMSVNSEITPKPQRDPITGFIQPTDFKLQLQHQISHKQAENTCLLVIQFDFTTALGKTIGNEYWNLAITDLADYLQNKVPNAQITRLDKTSFALAIKQDDITSAELYIDELYHWLIEKPFVIDATPMKLTCNIGMSTYYEGCDSNTFLSQAIAACGIACSREDGHTHRFHQGDDKIGANIEDSKWSEVIKQAIAQEKFLTVFQPIINLCSAPSEKYEVLLRMLDRRGKEILPGEFLGAAASTGFMPSIDRWVIANSCNQLVKRYAQGVKSQFFVKLSKESLIDDSLALFIGEQLRATRLPGNSLVFEVTEATACSHLQQTEKLFAALKQLNCLTALDHVGIAETPMLLPQALVVDYVKITGSLIADLNNNKENQDKVKTIVQRAHLNNALTIAQFVQSADTLAFLWQVGVNYIQGYFFQRPGTALVYDFTSNDD